MEIEQLTKVTKRLRILLFAIAGCILIALAAFLFVFIADVGNDLLKGIVGISFFVVFVLLVGCLFFVSKQWEKRKLRLEVLEYVRSRKGESQTVLDRLSDALLNDELSQLLQPLPISGKRVSPMLGGKDSCIIIDGRVEKYFAELTFGNKGVSYVVGQGELKYADSTKLMYAELPESLPELFAELARLISERAEEVKNQPVTKKEYF